ncbi:MAG: HU family DNA-binding protein [Patescibacteria group bacterium]
MLYLDQITISHMNKAELAEAIAARVGVTKKEAEDMVEAFTDITTQNLQMNGEVVLAGFGTFSARVRAGRMGVNPQKISEQIQINPTKVAKFKAGKNLKEALKKSQHTTTAAAPVPEVSVPTV